MNAKEILYALDNGNPFNIAGVEYRRMSAGKGVLIGSAYVPAERYAIDDTSGVEAVILYGYDNVPLCFLYPDSWGK